MNKFPALVCLCIAFNLTVVYSQKLPNTLLWRISGNGLQKPSYLYGTMHLTDERLFNLGDSLYSAIEKSEGFAIEVNPEDLTAYMVDEISKEIRNVKLVKDVLTQKEFKKYGNSLSKKLKKPADKITTRDILMEKNKWVTESFKKGEMSTFLDAYLFDIARRQGKWTGGVEDVDDQKGLLDNLVDESDIRQIAIAENADAYGRADEFIKVYVSNDLNAIDILSSNADSSYVDNILTKRNLKMARRMDSLGKIRSMVFAVGAAHLPGKIGLINLLQKDGYKVEPVFSSKKIKPSNYKVKEVDIPWVTINDADSFYTVKMPGRAGDIEMFGMLKMKMNFDIFNSTGYMVAAVPTPLNEEGIDSIMDFYAKGLFKQKTRKAAKSITINGITGIELASTDEDGYKHGYILYKNHIIYIALGIATRKNPKSEKDLDKFLSSYHAFEKKGNDNAHAFTYTDSTHFFTIALPSKPQSGKDLVNSGSEKYIRSSLMLSFDNYTGAYYFFGVNQAAPGYFIENDSTTLRNIERDLKPKLSYIKMDTFYPQNKDRVLKMEGIMSKAGVYTRTYYQITGNRWFTLLAMYDSSKTDPNVERFFKSFKILDSPPLEWKQQSSEDGLISTWIPGKLANPGNTGDEIQYTGKYGYYDSTKGDNYEVLVSPLGRYFWQNSDSALWEAIQKSNTGYNETIVSQKQVSNGNFRGLELQLKQDNSYNIKRKRILLYGDTLYTLITVQPQYEVNNININKFFSEFSFNHQPGATTIFTSKAGQLINDLSHKDSAVRTAARHALPTANFQVSDLPLLYRALPGKYIVDGDSYKSINEELADVIINLKDSSSLKIAKEIYLATDSDKVKNLLLDIISEYKTKSNFADLKGLLLQAPPSTELSYSFIRNLKDSLALTADLALSLLPLLKDTSIAPAIISICADLMDSNIISSRELGGYFKEIEAFAEHRFKKLRIDSETDYYNDRFIIALLGKLNNPKSNAVLQKWLTLNNGYLNLKCLEVLLRNGQVINVGVMIKLAADRQNRINLYAALEKGNRLALFPKPYLTQQYFAESNVFVAASDDAEPSALKYLTQKITMFNGKKARFFFYKVTYDDGDDKTSYLACAGPFNPDPGIVFEDVTEGFINLDEVFEQSNLQMQINALLEQASREE